MTSVGLACAGDVKTSPPTHPTDFATEEIVAVIAPNVATIMYVIVMYVIVMYVIMAAMFIIQPFVGARRSH